MKPDTIEKKHKKNYGKKMNRIKFVYNRSLARERAQILTGWRYCVYK